MSHPDTSPKIKISIVQADSAGHVVLAVASGPRIEHHHLTLAQARTLSLELIKQVYQAELKIQLKKPQYGHMLSKPSSSATHQGTMRHG